MVKSQTLLGLCRHLSRLKQPRLLLQLNSVQHLLLTTHRVLLTRSHHITREWSATGLVGVVVVVLVATLVDAIECSSPVTEGVGLIGTGRTPVHMITTRRDLTGLRRLSLS